MCLRKIILETSWGSESGLGKREMWPSTSFWVVCLCSVSGHAVFIQSIFQYLLTSAKNLRRFLRAGKFKCQTVNVSRAQFQGTLCFCFWWEDTQTRRHADCRRQRSNYSSGPSLRLLIFGEMAAVKADLSSDLPCGHSRCHSPAFPSQICAKLE